jgi:hypothetical protein
MERKKNLERVYEYFRTYYDTTFAEAKQNQTTLYLSTKVAGYNRTKQGPGMQGSPALRAIKLLLEILRNFCSG